MSEEQFGTDFGANTMATLTPALSKKWEFGTALFALMSP
jgi:hypothetical protein